MTVFGSEAIALILYVFILPLALMFLFKSKMLMTSLIAFWLTALFLLSLKLYMFIPQAFKGSYISIPQSAGNLIILSAFIVAIVVSFTELSKIKTQTQDWDQKLFPALTISLALLPILLFSYAFWFSPLKNQTIDDYTTIIFQVFWVLAAVLGLSLEVLSAYSSITIHKGYRLLAGFFILIGTLLYDWHYIKLYILNQTLKTSTLPFYLSYKTYLYAAFIVFATGLVIALWQNRKTS